jgi:hypothetical protein
MNTLAYQRFQKSFAKFVEEYNKELLEKLSELPDEHKKVVEEVLGTMTVKPENTKSSAPKKKRAPTPYNNFMKFKIKELRESHPDIDKTELMRMGAAEWQEKKKTDAAAKAEQDDKDDKDTKDEDTSAAVRDDKGDTDKACKETDKEDKKKTKTSKK